VKVEENVGQRKNFVGYMKNQKIGTKDGESCTRGDVSPERNARRENKLRDGCECGRYMVNTKTSRDICW